jgi:hypothetical protein
MLPIRASAKGPHSSSPFRRGLTDTTSIVSGLYDTCGIVKVTSFFGDNEPIRPSTDQVASVTCKPPSLADPEGISSTLRCGDADEFEAIE